MRIPLCLILLTGCATTPRPSVNATDVDLAAHPTPPEDETVEPTVFTDADFEEPPPPPPMRRWSTQAMGARRHCASANQARHIRCTPPREESVEPLRLAVIGLPPAAMETQSFASRAETIFGYDVSAHTYPADTDPSSLTGVDVIVLPSGWAQYAWTPIASHADSYRRFVEAGGGLLMFQPNPYELPGDNVTVDFLETPFTVANSYHDHCVIPVAPHPVLCGLHPSELPYPADRITHFGQSWKLLARGAETGHGSLIIAELGQGRAAVDSDNNTSRHMVKQRQHVSHSDELLRRLILWLAGRLH